MAAWKACHWVGPKVDQRAGSMASSKADPSVWRKAGKSEILRVETKEYSWAERKAQQRADQWVSHLAAQLAFPKAEQKACYWAVPRGVQRAGLKVVLKAERWAAPTAAKRAVQKGDSRVES